MSEFEGVLPFGWIATTLGDVCSQPQYGYTTKGSDTGTLRLLRTTDITSGNINWESVPFCLENPDDEDKYLLQDGDIVISRAGSVGVSYLLKNPERSVFASYLIRFKPYIHTQYFKCFLDSPYYWKEIADNKLGIAVPNVNASKLKDIAIPLPPENEQHRIVAKIEELFSELDKGVEALKTAREQLKVYRQALLKHAFEGKLTATWRDANPEKLEPAAALLARIQRDREQRYRQQLQQWQTTGGNKPKAPKPLPPLTAEELAELPELPEGWGWVKFGQVFSVYVGSTPSRKHNDCWGGVIPWVSSGEVAFNRIKNTKEKITALGFENTSTEIHPVGTVMLAMIGEGKTRGQAAILDIEASHNQNTAAIRVSESGCSPDFVYQYLVYRYEITRKIGSGNNQKALNKERVSELTMPLCSISEMNELVRCLDEKLSEADQLDQTLSTSLQQSEALRQSILKRAFSGQLVAQDPHDEPAAVLLARIRAERKQPHSPKRGRKAA